MDTYPPPVRLNVKGQRRLDSRFLRLGISGINYDLNMDRRYKLAKAPRLYRIWAEAKAVCNNPDHPYYSLFGGRYIIVCNDWIYRYNTFEVWAEASGYTPVATLCRHNLEADFNPDNCYWGPPEEATPVFYQRCNVFRWCLLHPEMDEDIIQARLDKGWPVARAFTHIPEKKRKVNHG